MLNIEKSARETLRYLFAEYQKSPATIHSINGIAKKYRVDPVLLSDYLLAHDWIRERYTGLTVACKITIKGIEEIDPAYVREKLRQVIGGLGEAGGSKELIEILSYRLEEYSVALDIVRQLEQLGMIEIRHPKASIIIQLTEKGRRFYERGNRTFFTLMTY